MKKQNNGHCMPNDAKCASKATMAPESKEKKQQSSAPQGHHEHQEKKAAPQGNAEHGKGAWHKK